MESVCRKWSVRSSKVCTAKKRIPIGKAKAESVNTTAAERIISSKLNPPSKETDEAGDVFAK